MDYFNPDQPNDFGQTQAVPSALYDVGIQLAAAGGHDVNDPRVQAHVTKTADNLRAQNPGVPDEQIADSLKKNLPAMAPQIAAIASKANGIDPAEAQSKLSGLYEQFAQQYGPDAQAKTEQAYQDKLAAAKSSRDMGQAFSFLAGSGYKSGYDNADKDYEVNALLAKDSTLGSFDRKKASAKEGLDMLDKAETHDYNVQKRGLELNQLKRAETEDLNQADKDSLVSQQSRQIVGDRFKQAGITLPPGFDTMSAKQIEKLGPMMSSMVSEANDKVKFAYQKQHDQMVLDQQATIHRDDMAQRSADRGESRAMRMAMYQDKKTDKQNEETEKKVEHFGKDAAGSQNLFNSYSNVEAEIAKTSPGFNMATYNADKGTYVSSIDGKEKKMADLPGISIPGIGRVSAYSESARALQSSMDNIFNVTLKDRSGAAVTNQEMERLKAEFASGKWNTESDMLRGLSRYRTAVSSAIKNAEAKYPAAVVDTYSSRGGVTSKNFAAQGAAVAPNGMVRMVRPDGQERDVPADKVNAAESAGYKRK
jgi:hypothetical protein